MSLCNHVYEQSDERCKPSFRLVCSRKGGVKDCSRRERSCELAAEVQRAFRPQTMRFIRNVLPGTQ